MFFLLGLMRFLIAALANKAVLKAQDTIGRYSNTYWQKNLLPNEQWRAVDSIKQCEKWLPLK